MPKAIRSAKKSSKKAIPNQFVLDALEPLERFGGERVRTRAMFGSLAVYIDDLITLILREKEDWPEDNGVWLATDLEWHESLRREFPSMRSIGFLGEPPTRWQNIPSDSLSFEEEALHACELVVRRDPRLGRIPDRQRKKLAKKAGEGKKAKSSGPGRGQPSRSEKGSKR